MADWKLPPFVTSLVDRLETAGFATYAVGGCVRDMLLGLAPQDYDLCTAALPEETEAIFANHGLVLAGKKHGTVGVITPEGVVEITTFRTEGTYQDNRHPDWVRFVPNVEEDLARRDFTVNAMAYSPTRGFADPFGGQLDLAEKILRAVGNPAARFREDSLRILRGIRFAVRFHLKAEEETLSAMHDLAPLMENLARERVFCELCKLLPLISAEDLLRYGPILAHVIPELAPMLGFDQRNVHHAYDLFTHTAYVTEAVPPSLPLRWAALLHDVGKIPAFTVDANGCGHFYGHAQLGSAMADGILHRLKAPNALREQVVWLIDHHMIVLTPEKKTLRRQLGRWGADNFAALLALQQADFSATGTHSVEEKCVFQKIAALLQEIQTEDTCLSLKDLAIGGQELLEIGFAPGKALGSCLDHLLNLVLDEAIPNEPGALLEKAREYAAQHGLLSENPYQNK